MGMSGEQLESEGNVEEVLGGTVEEGGDEQPEGGGDEQLEGGGDEQLEGGGDEQLEGDDESPFGGYDLYDPEGGNLPRWMSEYSDYETETGRKISVAREELDNLPEAGRRVVHNLQRGFTQRTQQLAEARKEVQAKAESLAQRAARVRAEEIGLRKRFVTAQQEFLASIEQLQEPDDPYSQEALEVRAAKAAAKTVADRLFGAIVPQMEAAEEEVRKDEAAQAAAERKAEIRTFIAETEDFEDYRARVVELRKEMPSVRVERLYLIARGENPAAAPRQPARPSLRERTRRVGSGRPSANSRAPMANEPPPEVVAKGMNAIFEWHKSNAR